jgi:hypothetical protein
MRSFVYGALGCLLTLGMAVVCYAQYGDYRARAESQAMLEAIEPTAETVLSNARKLHSTNGSGREIEAPESRFGTVEVMKDGVIVLRGKRDQLMVLVPLFGGYHYGWRCIGGPKNDVPQFCAQ